MPQYYNYYYGKISKPQKRFTYRVLGFEQAAQVVDDAVHAGDLVVFVTLLHKKKKKRKKGMI